MMESSCLRCGKCCTRFAVCITPFDIIRIMDATGKGPAGFVDSVPEPPARERTEPAIMIDGEMSLLVLKRGDAGDCAPSVPGARRARSEGEANVCHFYSQSGCRVYFGRPMLCRSYPFSVQCSVSGVLNFVDVRSRACERRWLPEGAEKKQYLRDCVQYKDEVAAYKKIADEWNKAGGSMGEFLTFAIQKASESPSL